MDRHIKNEVYRLLHAASIPFAFLPKFVTFTFLGLLWLPIFFFCPDQEPAHRLILIVNSYIAYNLKSTSHWSGARESREIERGNLSIQSLNPVSGHILTDIGRAGNICPILSIYRVGT